MFSKTDAYDNLVGSWSARLALLFLDFTEIRDGERVLDVGCGTGALCRAVLDTTRSSEVVGVDTSAPFIGHARAHRADPRISYEMGNVLHLPYPDAEFDQSLALLVFQFLLEGKKRPERCGA